MFPNSRLKGRANLLIMPNLDAANITLNLLRYLGEGTSIGPVLLGAAKTVHILDASITVRGIVNVSAIAVAEAADRNKPQARG
jgi:malate dehydrogenase (oxaloacetate-decarboxylating)(NADP+)